MRRGRQDKPIQRTIHPLGPAVRLWRGRVDLTITALALRTGIDKAWISKLEHGHIATVSYERQEHLAQGLGITVEDLWQPTPTASAEVATDAQLLPTSAPAGRPGKTTRSVRAQAERGDSVLEEELTKAESTIKAALADYRSQFEQGVQRKQQEHEASILRRIVVQAGRGRRVAASKAHGVGGEDYFIYLTPERIVRYAIQLIQSLTAPKLGQTPEQKAIVITWRNDDSPIDAIHDAELRAQWVGALRTTQERGFDYIHLIEPSGLHRKVLQAVYNVVALLGTGDHYQPHLLPARGLAEQDDIDYVLIPSKGIFELHGSRRAHFYPVGGKHFEALHAEVMQIQQEKRDLYDGFPRTSPKRRQALVDLEVAPGDRYLFLDGLCQTTVPFKVHQQRHDALVQRLHEKGDIKAAGEILDQRERRIEATEEHLRQGWRRYDICTKRAIQRLATRGYTTSGDIDDSLAHLGAPPLTPQQRILHLQSLIDHLNAHPNYELVLLDGADVDVCRAYFLVKQGQGVLLQFWDPRPGGDPHDPKQHMAILLRDAAVVRAFAANSLLQQFERPHKRDVIEFLQQQMSQIPTV